MTKICKLTAGPIQMEIAPQLGGSVLRLDLLRNGRVTEVFRAAAFAEVLAGDARAAAMFPMVPFANRVPGNKVTAVAPPISLPPNIEGQPFATHGIGWQRRWQVLEHHDHALRLLLEVAADEYPIPFRAIQSFHIDGQTLSLAMELLNPSPMPMPAGIGFHPFFPRTQATTLRFVAATLWPNGPGNLPLDPIPVPPRPDYARGAPLPQRAVNECYSDWDGTATVSDPERALEITLRASSTLSALMLYAPAGQSIFCLEPQSHVSGRVAEDDVRSGVGLALLQPGESLCGSLQIEITSGPSS